MLRTLNLRLLLRLFNLVPTKDILNMLRSNINPIVFTEAWSLFQAKPLDFVYMFLLTYTGVKLYFSSLRVFS